MTNAGAKRFGYVVRDAALDERTARAERACVRQTEKTLELPTHVPWLSTVNPKYDMYDVEVVTGGAHLRPLKVREVMLSTGVPLYSDEVATGW
jgi:hypothetical protein